MSKDCQLHWENHLSPQVNKGQWTKEEDKKLLRLAARNKDATWVTITRELGVSVCVGGRGGRGYGVWEYGRMEYGVLEYGVRGC